MSDLISWQELSENFGVKEPDVIDRFDKGLKPYTRFGKPKKCPRFWHEGNILEHELSNLETDIYVLNNEEDSRRQQVLLSDSNLTRKEKIKELKKEKKKIENRLKIIRNDDKSHSSWKYFKIPKSDESIEGLFSDLNDYLFKKSDILEHFPKTDKDTLLSEAYIGKKVRDHVSTREKLARRRERKIICFYKKNKIWKIGEKGKEVDFTHRKGFEHIHFLIRNRNKTLLALEVYLLGDIPPELKKQKSEVRQLLGKLKDGDFKKALDKLEEDLSKETDPVNRIEINEKMEELTKYQKAGEYPFKKENYKSVKNVYKNIKNAVDVIQEELKENNDDGILEIFKVGKWERIKSGVQFCFREDLINFDIEWRLDP